MAGWLIAQGHEALHTKDLPAGNRISDAALNDLSASERRVPITKDADFVDSFLLHRRPHKPLLIATGNIGNRNWCFGTT